MRALLLLLLACGAPAPRPADPVEPTPAVVPTAEVVEPAPLPAGWVEQTTGGADPTEALPLVVVVHGLGDTPRGIVGLLDGLPAKARVVAPRAPLPYGRGASWFSVRVRDGEVELLSTDVARAADGLAEALGALDRPTVGKPVLTGFSQGGMLSFAVAVRHPDAIAGAVPVAGWLPPPLLPDGGPPLGAPPIRAVHGDADPVLPLAPTAESVAQLRQLGWDVQLEVFPGVEHRIPPPVREAVHARILELLPGGTSRP